MTKALTLLPVLFCGLAACTMGDFPLDENGNPIYPEAVVAALPQGVDPAIVFLADNGCYAFEIEKTDPRTGFPLIGRDGAPVCAVEQVASAQ